MEELQKIKQFELTTGIKAYDEKNLYADCPMEGVEDAVTDHLYDFIRTCHSRPPLPWEREEYGYEKGQRIITEKGMQKYDREKERIQKVAKELLGKELTIRDWFIMED